MTAALLGSYLFRERLSLPFWIKDTRDNRNGPRN